MNAECRRQKAEWRRRAVFCILASAFCLLHSSALANDLTVDPKSLRPGETLSIFVTLEDTFAHYESLDIPVSNIRIVGEPSTSTEFTWINGKFTRRRRFSYAARAIDAGPATVGPLVIESTDGQRITLPAIAVQVVPDHASGTNDPPAILRELLATGRDPFFVVAEVDRERVFAGEPVVVTWMLYNAANVQQWQISSIPKLEDFWVEELDVRQSQPTQAILGNMVLQKLPIRRVALFPLRGGALKVGSMEVETAIMRRVDTGPFGLFEGNLVEVRYASAPFTIAVQPLPPGPPVDAVGDLALNCTPPDQSGGGPVTFTATLAGRGNVRAAAAPRWLRPVDANVQIEDRGVERNRETGEMTRRWRYVLFPGSGGRLEVPALAMNVFSPAAGARQQLRCEATSLLASAAEPIPPLRTAPPAPGGNLPLNRGRVLLWIMGAGAVLLIGGLAARRLLRAMRVRRDVRKLAHAGSAAEICDAVHARFAVDASTLMRDPTERGEAYRALRSILDAVERDRVSMAEAEDDIERRLGDLVLAYNRGR